MNSRYQYATELEYQLHTYEDKIKFAKYKVESQRDKAVMRKRDEEFELKLYAGILLALVILLPLSFIMSFGKWNFLALIGVPLLFVAAAGWVYAMPISIYKMIKGAILYSINKRNKLGEWFLRRYEIPFVNTEISTCQIYINKYRVLLENIEKWKEEISEGSEGQLEFPEEQILRQLESVDLEPQIEVATMRWGKMMKFVRRVTIICMMVVYPTIVFLEFSVLVKIYKTSLMLIEQL